VSARASKVAKSGVEYTFSAAPKLAVVPMVREPILKSSFSIALRNSSATCSASAASAWAKSTANSSPPTHDQVAFAQPFATGPGDALQNDIARRMAIVSLIA
jgi:hypothetical protein